MFKGILLCYVLRKFRKIIQPFRPTMGYLYIWLGQFGWQLTLLTVWDILKILFEMPWTIFHHPISIIFHYVARQKRNI
jgi:hypothetical protein